MIDSESPVLSDAEAVNFLQWALPQLQMRWPGYRRVRRQVVRRIRRRLIELGIGELAAYRDYIERHPAEWSVLDSFCRISISRFYRDRDVFDHLRDVVLPELAAELHCRNEVDFRCWSVGCASGEEPYTLAIIWHVCLADRFPNTVFRVTATDSDPQMLARAQQAVYGRTSVKDLPAEWLPRAFDCGSDQYRLKADLRRYVDFAQQDIRCACPPGPFHLVLCRHLAFTYFDEGRQREVLKRITTAMDPAALLVTAKKETLPAESGSFVTPAPQLGIYRHLSR